MRPPPRRLRVTAAGLWVWRLANGTVAAVVPHAIHLGPGGAWFQISGPGWQRQPGQRRRAQAVRLALAAASLPHEPWRQLLVALRWRTTQVAEDAPLAATSWRAP